MTKTPSVLAEPRRRSGLLLHPTSLPSPGGIGTLGTAAYAFVDFLAAAGQTIWQVLPIGPVGAEFSPYCTTSAFAGNPLLIDLEVLREAGWLPTETAPEALPRDGDRIDFEAVEAHKLARLAEAFEGFEAGATDVERTSLEAFCASQSWLEDFVLFTVLSEHNTPRATKKTWVSWPVAQRQRRPAALAKLRRRFARELARERFIQWVFFNQWGALRRYANAKGVGLFGDIPIFVAHHSADVWANPELFSLDAGGTPTHVAGVPPDYFSATGQVWGNPVYRWDVMAKDGYAWWVRRFEMAQALFDAVRIDHFRGFAAYWAIPDGEETAVNGSWRPGPGLPLFEAIKAALGDYPIIAEDLGDITPDVELLRDTCGFPGMKILQFGFGGDATNVHLPHNYPQRSVVYTGTHDNDTTLGWFDTAPAQVRAHLMAYAGLGRRNVAFRLLKEAWRSCARFAIAPVQDVLGLGGEARMNVPGVAGGNWGWRVRGGALEPKTGRKLAKVTRLYGR